MHPRIFLLLISLYSDDLPDNILPRLAFTLQHNRRVPAERAVFHHAEERGNGIHQRRFIRMQLMVEHRVPRSTAYSAHSETAAVAGRS